MISVKDKSSDSSPNHVIGDRVARSKRWLVAQVTMNHEKKIGERLQKMGIETFVPIQQETHQWSDRRKVVDRVLLPMMIFVHVDVKEQKEVLTLTSVIRYMVLRGESTPAVIPNEQMDRFRFMLDYSEESVCMTDPALERGDHVRVVKGPLQGLEGELVSVDGKSKVVVRVNMLGCACVDMPVGFVEVMEK